MINELDRSGIGLEGLSTIAKVSAGKADFSVEIQTWYIPMRSTARSEQHDICDARDGRQST
jgi:hypothetical protein